MQTKAQELANNIHFSISSLHSSAGFGFKLFLTEINKFNFVYTSKYYNKKFTY